VSEAEEERTAGEADRARGGREAPRVRPSFREVAAGLLRRPELASVALAGYRRERWTEVSFPIAAGLMEGGFVGVVADKVFHVHPGLIALASAAPMFGNLSSFVWAALAHGRRRVPLVVALQCAFAAVVGTVAFLPAHSAGGAFFVGCMVACRLLLTGTTTVRSLVWTLNYPRETRARVAARLSLRSSLTITATAMLGGFALDLDPDAFRLLYAAGAVFALVGATAFSGVPVIDEEAHLAHERSPGREAPGARAEHSVGAALGLLRDDRLYARYLGWQFLLGVANMMIEPPLVYLVSRELGASYRASIAITLVIPLATSIVTMPLWAAYLDRVHITRFRSRHSWLWVGSQLLLWIGALAGSLPLIAFARVILGTGSGGGSLAWQLGHNDFADARRAGLYMGVHVTLTGVRGAFAPFAGMLLYLGWPALAVPGTALALPAFAGLGAHVMLMASALSTIATLGFLRMERSLDGVSRQ
jgi:MFS family permease